MAAFTPQCFSNVTSHMAATISVNASRTGRQSTSTHPHKPTTLHTAPSPHLYMPRGSPPATHGAPSPPAKPAQARRRSRGPSTTRRRARCAAPDPGIRPGREPAPGRASGPAVETGSRPGVRPSRRNRLSDRHQRRDPARRGQPPDAGMTPGSRSQHQNRFQARASKQANAYAPLLPARSLARSLSPFRRPLRPSVVFLAPPPRPAPHPVSAASLAPRIFETRFVPWPPPCLAPAAGCGSLPGPLSTDASPPGQSPYPLAPPPLVSSTTAQSQNSS